jgi:hypothetical protein
MPTADWPGDGAGRADIVARGYALDGSANWISWDDVNGLFAPFHETVLGTI